MFYVFIPSKNKNKRKVNGAVSGERRVFIIEQLLLDLLEIRSEWFLFLLNFRGDIQIRI